MHFVLAGCGVCIPSFSVPKHSNVSDLEKVVSHLIAAAVRNARNGKELESSVWLSETD